MTESRIFAPPVVILRLPSEAAGISNAAKVAAFCGLSVTEKIIGAETGLANSELWPRENGGCIVATVPALLALAERKGGVERLREEISTSQVAIFIYGFGAAPEEAAWLATITAGKIPAVEMTPDPALAYRVEAEARDLAPQLAAMETGPAGWSARFPNAGGRVLSRTGGEPSFVQVTCGLAQLFFAGGTTIADLDGAVPEGVSTVSFAPTLLPLMMTLRFAFPQQVWRNDAPQGCLIIDDPLLRPRYGFLDYQKLLEATQQHQLSTSIAFIPWNHQRTEKGTADLFRAQPRRLSLCVHGCDHTWAEFGTKNAGELHWRASTAVRRMEAHTARANLPYDRVMVFPQGIFSEQAMRALQATGYLAAVNTSPYPAGDLAGPLTLRELLEVAVTRFDGLPLFVRRYPRQVAEFAFDLFLGKPALIVEHHAYFQDGFSPLVKFLDQLIAAEPRLEWGTVGEVCAGTCLKKVTLDGEIHRRFFTDRLVLPNDSDEPRTVHLERPRARREAPIRAVLINGEHRLRFTESEDAIRFAINQEPRGVTELTIDRNPPAVRVPPFQQRAVDRCRVYWRRHLSEFRDNVLARLKW